MVALDAIYEGQLHCRVTHGPSGAVFSTDAPVDNHGRGATFSPTDLVAAALGTCLLTTMGIVAERHQINLTGTAVHVTKEMVSTPTRRIGRLEARITFPTSFDASQRDLLERAAAHCPVHASLHPDLQTVVTFTYPS